MGAEPTPEQAKAARKLAKKRKREEAAAVAAASNGAAAEDAPQKRKKDKKAKQQPAGAPAPVANGAEAAEAPKKKKKKQKGSENGAAEAPAQANGAAEAEKPTKPKKQKQKAATAASEPSAGRVVQQQTAQLARIGDQEAAGRLPPLQKALYSEHAEVRAQSEASVAAWQAERGIAVENCSLRPITDFKHTGLPEAMLHATRTFQSPSPIQAQCLPIVLAGRDLVGIAATGSGKTLAFGLPCLRHTAAQKEGGAAAAGKGQPRALMLSPTRELAQQIAAVMAEAGERCGVSTVCVYGGVPKKEQARQLKRGVDVVVATPGRLEDLMNDGSCSVGSVSYLVLDEADRMLDLGFEPHIRAIAGQTRADRQTLMFSATWPSEVQRLAMDYLVNPARVAIGSQDLSASHSVTQIVEVIEPDQRPQRLLQLLKKYHSSRRNRVLVFVLYKKEAGRVEQALQRAGWKAASIHGDISQAQRSAAVEQFKAGTAPLLIATDVAARGLDIPDVEAVINYSFPLTTEDYVHRIGRTGRAGKTGVAHTFFSGATDKPRSGELIQVLREAGQEVPPELLKFGTTTKKKESKLYGAHFKEVDLSQKATKIVFDD